MDTSEKAYTYHNRLPKNSQPRLSARLQGVKAPYVRTSLSPDLVLRQRTKRIREILRGSGHDEIIEISSDSDTEAAPRRSDGRVGHALPLPHETRRQTAPPAPHPSTFPKATRTIIDLTRDFEEPLPRRKRARTIPIQTYRVPPRRTRLPDISVRVPSWIRVCLQDIRKTLCEITIKHDFREVCTSSGATKWEAICLLCDPETSIAAGPGKTLDAFGYHAIELFDFTAQPPTCHFGRLGIVALRHDAIGANSVEYVPDDTHRRQVNECAYEAGLYGSPIRSLDANTLITSRLSLDSAGLYTVV
ncbi:hypothetical protein VTO73DRAFT_84 [Trametes versicolor]